MTAQTLSMNPELLHMIVETLIVTTEASKKKLALPF
jgi:hypothetical protein